MTSKAQKSDLETEGYKNTALTHEARGVSGVGPNLGVDLDQALHDNRQNPLAGQSILEAVAEEDGEGKRFAELVGTGGWTRSLRIVRHFEKMWILRIRDIRT